MVHRAALLDEEGEGLHHAYDEGEGGEPDGENGKQQLQFLHVRYHHQPPPALVIFLKNGGFF